MEQVGYDPTPTDFQSAAMTTSATAPKNWRLCNLQSTFLCGRKSKSSKTSLAEGEGFEPPGRSRARWFSRPVQSTSLPTLQIKQAMLDLILTTIL